MAMSNDNVTQLTLISATAAFYAEVMELLFALRWAFALVVVMIMMDFCYGIADSVGKRGEDFHLSRAGRRTLCKFIEYITYPIVGGILGKAVLEPMGCGSMMMGGALGVMLAILFEADSISEHVCNVHNINKRFSVKGWIIKKLTDKFGKNESAAAAAAERAADALAAVDGFVKNVLTFGEVTPGTYSPGARELSFTSVKAQAGDSVTFCAIINNGGQTRSGGTFLLRRGIHRYINWTEGAGIEASTGYNAVTADVTQETFATRAGIVEGRVFISALTAQIVVCDADSSNGYIIK